MTDRMRYGVAFVLGYMLGGVVLYAQKHFGAAAGWVPVAASVIGALYMGFRPRGAQ